jgi:hypothetical protein
MAVCGRALPVLVWQRQNWNIVYPYVEINEVEVNDLKTAAPYVAGFTDAAIESHTELYDVFVNGRYYSTSFMFLYVSIINVLSSSWKFNFCCSTC